MQQQKTKTHNQEQIQENWYVIDAKGQRIGFLATMAAEYLLGKNDVTTRDYLQPKTKVVIINAEKVDVTEKKKYEKIFTRYSGYPGGLTRERLGELMERRPIQPLKKAIKGMLPKGSRGRQLTTNLYIYEGEEHPHTAQKPQKIDIKEAKL